MYVACDIKGRPISEHQKKEDASVACQRIGPGAILMGTRVRTPLRPYRWRFERMENGSPVFKAISIVYPDGTRPKLPKEYATRTDE